MHEAEGTAWRGLCLAYGFDWRSSGEWEDQLQQAGRFGSGLGVAMDKYARVAPGVVHAQHRTVQ